MRWIRMYVVFFVSENSYFVSSTKLNSVRSYIGLGGSLELNRQTNATKRLFA